MGGGSGGRQAGVRHSFDPGCLTVLLLLSLGSYAALSVDVVRTGFGIKGDEATYVAMALSAAYDGDLAYQATDIDRFYRLYKSGPEGIFLKRGGGSRIRADRLYFGKSYAYPVAAAPFVRIAGLNGLLLFHVLLLAGMFWGGYKFLVARSPSWLSLPYVLGFFGVSIVPLYAVFLTSEIFNVACVFFAFFLWSYKEVAPTVDGPWARWLRSQWSDVAAAALLGVVTFSKPSHVFLVIPLVMLAGIRRRYRKGVATGVVFALVVAGGFGINGAISGELNYQGGDRKTFYGEFPFERADAEFDTLGIGMTTNEVVVDEALSPVAFLTLFSMNLGYFVAGRHFGFLPFFFPGVVVIALFLWHRADQQWWQWGILGTVVATAIGLVVYMPYTWSGGGGPPGNRYFLSIYPALFFLTPPLTSVVPVLVAWLGGALFTAHILINPFVAAKQPYLSVERGMLRALPVELTMVNDLPINLDASRTRVEYGDPTLLLYYLDHNAYLPETPGICPLSTAQIWIAARRQAEIIVRSGPPLRDMTLTLRSPISNTVNVSLGGASQTVRLEAGVVRRVTLVPDGVYARQSWAYVLSVRTQEGFVPRLTERDSRDSRYLGVAIDLNATLGKGGPPSLRGW